MEPEKQREGFGSRLGFILVSAGCAIGIGNVWRFPTVTGQYGGGIFVLFYLIFLVLMGLPVLTMELAVGRAHEHHRRDALILGNLRGARAGVGDEVLAERDLVGHVAVLVEDVLEELHPLRVGLRGVAQRREADGRDAGLAE